MEHTPIPWMRNGETMNGWRRIDGSSERVGIDFLNHPAAIVPDETDADFVVRAVNSHADLLAALERLLGTPTDSPNWGPAVVSASRATKSAKGA